MPTKFFARKFEHPVDFDKMDRALVCAGLWERVRSCVLGFGFGLVCVCICVCVYVCVCV